MKKIKLLQKIVECLVLFGAGVLITMAFSAESMNYKTSIIFLVIGIVNCIMVTTNQVIREMEITD